MKKKIFKAFRLPESAYPSNKFPSITVSQWAEQNRIISGKTAMFPGKWSNAITPFLVEPMDALCDKFISQVTVVACVQSGKTEISLNFLGWIADKFPRPTLFVMPRELDCKRRVSGRIRPLFKSTPTLFEKVGRDVRNVLSTEPTIMKDMILYLGWSGSPAALADTPACFVILDEVGKFEDSLKGSDQILMAKGRTTTFGPESKIYICSSPEGEGNPLHREWEMGDKREWYVKCPYCNQWQILSWGNVHLEKNEDGFLFPPSYYQYEEKVWWICKLCKHKWTESERWNSVQKGKWVPAGCSLDDEGNIVGDIPKTKKRSYRITAFMTHPSFEKTNIKNLAAEWAEAQISLKKGNNAPLKIFITECLAEFWKEATKITEDKKIMSHIGTYEMGKVPEGVQMLTCGIDVQSDHLWFHVIGFGYLSEVWTIWAGRLETGDTRDIRNWEILRKFLHTPFPYQQDPKKILPIYRIAIDTGYRPELVYDFVRQCRELSIIPVAGAGRDMSAPFKDEDVQGGILKRYDINTTHYKDRIYNFLFENEVSGTAYWHLPSDVTQEILNQLTSEEKVVVRRYGKSSKMQWKPKGDRPNHLWDCAVYALFAGEIAGAYSLLPPGELARKIMASKKKKPVRTGGDDWLGDTSDYWR